MAQMCACSTSFDFFVSSRISRQINNVPGGSARRREIDAQSRPLALLLAHQPHHVYWIALRHAVAEMVRSS